MNENNIELVGDADTVATLVAANNALGGGEDTQPEGTYISDDANEAIVTVA